MDIGKYKQWTILDWEEQFRMEEANICAYFEEIPKYVDLPDEDELIISRLKERKLLLEDSALLENLLLYIMKLAKVQNHFATSSRVRIILTDSVDWEFCMPSGGWYLFILI